MDLVLFSHWGQLLVAIHRQGKVFFVDVIPRYGVNHISGISVLLRGSFHHGRLQGDRGILQGTPFSRVTITGQSTHIYFRPRIHPSTIWHSKKVSEPVQTWSLLKLTCLLVALDSISAKALWIEVCSTGYHVQLIWNTNQLLLQRSTSDLLDWLEKRQIPS